MQLSLLFVLFLATAAHSTDVNTDNGVITGSRLIVDGRPVWQFLGIPYAEPPLGDLRFRRPQPPKKWSKPLVADKVPKGCVQTRFEFMEWEESLAPKYGEDCLYVDVWTPSLDKEKKKSVLVFIHGGGFMFGEGLPGYNGKALASIGDVVAVTIQYRLSFLGFARFDDDLVPGNNGLWDQQMALKWVHDNIADFGGDPESVTIIGESAGSASVSYHLMNKESSRYFKRAILQSGSALNLWAFNPNNAALEALNRQTASKYLGCDQKDLEELLKCLRGKSEKEMFEAVHKFGVPLWTGPRLTPVVDGRFLTRTPEEIILSGGMQKKDIIVGVAEQEGGVFAKVMATLWATAHNKTAPTTEDLNEGFVNFSLDQMLHYLPFYPDKPSPAVREILQLLSRSHVDPKSGNHNAARLSQVLGYAWFYCDINTLADNYRKFHDTVYYYELAHKPLKSFYANSAIGLDWLKCTHGDDIAFVFPDLDRLPLTEEELHLARRIIGDFASFARTGAPRDPNWRPYSLEKKEVYRYSLSSTLQTGGVSRDDCVIWDRILPLVNRISAGKPASEGGRRARSDEL